MGKRDRFFGNVLVKLLASCLAQDVEQQLKTTKYQAPIRNPQDCNAVARDPAFKVPKLNKVGQENYHYNDILLAVL